MSDKIDAAKAFCFFGMMTGAILSAIPIFTSKETLSDAQEWTFFAVGVALLVVSTLVGCTMPNKPLTTNSDTSNDEENPLLGTNDGAEQIPMLSII